jgi:hypothetical protein
LNPSEEAVRRVIDKRIGFTESRMSVAPGSLIKIDDSGYKAICELTQNSIGLALEVVKAALPDPKKLAEESPYIITKERIKALGLTYENLREYWNGSLMSRGLHIIEVKPWWEA